MHCYCQCHVSPYPALTASVVDALTACASCAGAHRQPAMHSKPRIVSRRNVVVATHDGRQLPWDDYQREMEKRTDLWKRQCDGEGPEA